MIFENRDELALRDDRAVENVKCDIGLYLQSVLREIFSSHLLAGDIQGVGMVAALQLTKDKATRKRFASEDQIS